jgi:alpha-D-ribose 1-methylphosphonate 5-triphosphate synthase subunit PhnH
LQAGRSVVITGPGILDQRAISPTLPPNFWNFWQQNHQAYPQGIDVLLFTENTVMGLPRTAKVQQ